MRDFLCRNCGQQLSFENSLCLACRSPLGFVLATRSIVVLGSDQRIVVDGRLWERCANSAVAQCNWMVEWSGVATLCASCRLTRTRPRDDDSVAMAAFGQVEAAKRRVVLELVELGLTITARRDDPCRGLAFDLLSSAHGPVTTGHCDGVITLDLAEEDSVLRMQRRIEFAEPYRTVLGHFRHEVGHYYQMVLVDRPARPSAQQARRFRELFGDPDADYGAALRRYYDHGAPFGWRATHVSAYATSHPREDFAETFAHYLHIRDTLDTAATFAMAPASSMMGAVPAGDAAFDRLIGQWLPVSWVLNQLNRSMGHTDLYPFVLADPVVEKIRFVHALLSGE